MVKSPTIRRLTSIPVSLGAEMGERQPAASEDTQIKTESEKLRGELKVLSDQLADVAKQNRSIKEKIDSFMPLAEDAMGLRVFDKAKSYLVSWITVGGIATVIAGGVVFTEAWNYARDIIQSEAKTRLPPVITDEVKGEMSGFLKAEVARQVQDHFAHNPDEFSQVERTVVASVYVAHTNSGATVLRSGNAGDTTSASDTALDYSSQMLPVRNEGQEGSTVGFALSAVLEYQLFKATGQKVRLSPREIYNLARLAEHTLATDSGTSIRDGVKVVRTTGAIAEADWPYKAGEFSRMPPAGFGKMHKYKVRTAVLLKTVDDIKSALRNTGPVVIGITVYETITSPTVAKTGILPLPVPGEMAVGGHAVAIVGTMMATSGSSFRTIGGTLGARRDTAISHMPISPPISQMTCGAFRSDRRTQQKV
jgi:hypothetical protein